MGVDDVTVQLSDKTSSTSHGARVSVSHHNAADIKGRRWRITRALVQTRPHHHPEPLLAISDVDNRALSRLGSCREVMASNHGRQTDFSVIRARTRTVETVRECADADVDADTIVHVLELGMPYVIITNTLSVMRGAGDRFAIISPASRLSLRATAPLVVGAKRLKNPIRLRRVCRMKCQLVDHEDDCSSRGRSAWR
jgi:hypothetical protein